MQPSEFDIASSYDAVPYESFPFKQSHPAHLFTMATLFKMTPTPIEKCRVLELGCSSGGNIIPLAMNYPDSEFVGIDISRAEIEIGLNHQKALKLNNLTLKEMSISNFNKKEGKFDYIICHGVYSWVDNKTRKKILSICKNNLTPNGVAYISYNTLPGWNMVNSIRELMLWHTQSIEDPKQKVTQARMILKFIADGLSEDSSPYAQFLNQEIKGLTKQADNYIMHEHLSYYNEPIYFFQFMEEAKKHELAYLSDAMISTMFSGNLPPSFSSELGKVKNIIAANQYMDFIRNNRFRSTLLCHESQKIDRKLSAEDMSKCYLQLKANLSGNEFTEEMIKSKEEIKFSLGGVAIKSQNPNYKALFYILYQNRFHLLHYDEIKEKLKQYVEMDSKAMDKFLFEEVNLMRMVLAGIIHFSFYAPDYHLTLSDKPTACPLTRYQASMQNYVTNRLHSVTRLDPFAKAMIPLLDGTHSHADVIKKLVEKINKGELTLLDKDKKPITNEKMKQELLEQMYYKMLDKLAESAVLIG